MLVTLLAATTDAGRSFFPRLKAELCLPAGLGPIPYDACSFLTFINMCYLSLYSGLLAGASFRYAEPENSVFRL